MKEHDAKRTISRSKKEEYQDRLHEIAYLRSVEGLETSDAPGYRSQAMLKEAIKNHEINVDRGQYVKNHCHDPSKESQVKQNIRDPDAPPFLANGPVSKVYSLKQNYARPPKEVN